MTVRHVLWVMHFLLHLQIFVRQCAPVEVTALETIPYIMDRPSALCTTTSNAQEGMTPVLGNVKLSKVCPALYRLSSSVRIFLAPARSCSGDSKS